MCRIFLLGLLFMVIMEENISAQESKTERLGEIEYLCDSITESTLVTVVNDKIYVHNPDKSPLSLIDPKEIKSVQFVNEHKLVAPYEKLKGLKIIVVTLSGK